MTKRPDTGHGYAYTLDGHLYPWVKPTRPELRLIVPPCDTAEMVYVRVIRETDYRELLRQAESAMAEAVIEKTAEP